MKNKQRIALVVGDWSDDGHGRADHISIDCNISASKLEAAYKKGAKICDVDLTEHVCRDYQDSELDSESIERLEKFGFKIEDFLDGDEEPYHLDDDSFALLWLFIAKLGYPSLEYELVEDDYKNRINIGGYGLYQG